MKKIISVLAIFLLASCGSSNTSEVSNNITQQSPSVTTSSESPSVSISVPISDSVSIPLSDPYTSTRSDDFYNVNSYERADSYEDAMYRTANHFVSGDITPQGHLPVDQTGSYKSGDRYYRVLNANYVFDENNKLTSYRINKIDGSLGNTIYFGAAYTALEDVAAYILAFGELPPNSNYDKTDGKQDAIRDWGIYGRVNFDDFSNDTYKYPYEPELAEIERYRYVETDFGTIGGYSNGSYDQELYNNGYSINRGAARLVYTASYSNGSKITDINDRHVFYTYNHYNDFQEYLNYEGGWGLRFGSETAGNPYCSNKTEFNRLSNPKTPTAYPETENYRI